MKLLTKAIAYASKKHEGQKRKGTDIPFIILRRQSNLSPFLKGDERIWRN